MPTESTKQDPPGSGLTTILLVRHGQTPTTGKILPGRAKGLHLSAAGIKQAQHAGERLAKLQSVAAIYTSPLERARETAAPIGQALNLKPKVRQGLLECDFGDWTGAELAQLMKLPEWRTVQKAPSTFQFPNGESFTEMQGRLIATLDLLRREHPHQTVICVSHADCIKAVMAHALGTHLDLFQRIVISPASISAIAWSIDGPISLTVNSVGGSLAELQPS